MEKNRSFEELRSERYPMMEASPHLLFWEKTDRIMKLVVLALLPSVAASILFFWPAFFADVRHFDCNMYGL